MTKTTLRDAARGRRKTHGEERRFPVASDAACSAPVTLCCSRARRRVCPFPAQDSGGLRQFHLLWWQALGRIFAEEHSNVFVYEPGVVIGSHDHACFEAQRCIGKRLYDHTVSMKASAP